MTDKKSTVANVIGSMLLISWILIMFSILYAKENSKTYNGTYCKAGYIFIDEDTWHGNNDPQLIGENGSGVPCKTVK